MSSTFRSFVRQVRGRGHERDGTVGQDRTHALSRRGVQAICLADGAGSASQSEIGAQLLVRRGCDLLVERFHDFLANEDGPGVKREILQDLRGRLESVAQRRGCEVRDLAATFLAVAVNDDRFLVAHVGDGVIGFVRHGELRVASGPDNTEFANQTTFVSSGNALEHMRIFRGSLDGVTGFVLMSDGTANSLYDTRTRQLAPACGKLVALVGGAPTRQVLSPAHEKKVWQLLKHRIRDATNDDCSIAILGRVLPPT